jgi:hypothetical protein
LILSAKRHCFALLMRNVAKRSAISAVFDAISEAPEQQVLGRHVCAGEIPLSVPQQRWQPWRGQ